jgi:ribosomal protein S18 acetylase RimI-like enzyme
MAERPQSEGAMTPESMTAPLVLRRLAPGDDLAGVAVLMAGYLAEVRRRLLDGYGVALEDATPDGDLLVDIGPLLEPPQALYLADVDGRPAGTGGLKRVAPGVAEIKRMYTDPAFRGRGVARAVLTRLIADARAAGYRRLQLETAVWMVEAHALYRSCGFTDAEPFPDPEFGCRPGYEHLARYMSVRLDDER